MRIEVERDFMEGGGVRSRHLERGGLGYTLWNSGRVNGFGSMNKNTPRAAGALNVTAEGGFRSLDWSLSEVYFKFKDLIEQQRIIHFLNLVSAPRKSRSWHTKYTCVAWRLGLPVFHIGRNDG